jgi:hypothetical protein
LKKFKDKPNSEDMHLWLQRIALVANLNIKDAETELVKLIPKSLSKLFNALFKLPEFG